MTLGTVVIFEGCFFFFFYNDSWLSCYHSSKNDGFAFSGIFASVGFDETQRKRNGETMLRLVKNIVIGLN